MLYCFPEGRLQANAVEASIAERATFRIERICIFVQWRVVDKKEAEHRPTVQELTAEVESL